MPKVVTLSVLPPLLSKSSAVCADANPQHEHSTAASNFFMLTPPWDCFSDYRSMPHLRCSDSLRYYFIRVGATTSARIPLPVPSATRRFAYIERGIVSENAGAIER